MKREVLLSLLSLSSALTNNPVHALSMDMSSSLGPTNLVESCMLGDNFNFRIFESKFDALFTDKKNKSTYKGKIVVKFLKGNVGEIFFRTNDGKTLPILNSREDAVLFAKGDLASYTTDKDWNRYKYEGDCHETSGYVTCETIVDGEVKKPMQGVWLNISKTSHRVATLTFVDDFNPSLKLPVITNDKITYSSKGIHTIDLTLTSCE